MASPDTERSSSPEFTAKPMVAAVEALEHAAVTSHIKRLPILGIDNYRGAPAHGETGKAGVDVGQVCPPSELRKYALSPGRCVHGGGLFGVYRDGPRGRI